MTAVVDEVIKQKKADLISETFGKNKHYVSEKGERLVYERAQCKVEQRNGVYDCIKDIAVRQMSKKLENIDPKAPKIDTSFTADMLEESDLKALHDALEHAVTSLLAEARSFEYAPRGWHTPNSSFMNKVIKQVEDDAQSRNLVSDVIERSKVKGDAYVTLVRFDLTRNTIKLTGNGINYKVTWKGASDDTPNKKTNITITDLDVRPEDQEAARAKAIEHLIQEINRAREEGFYIKRNIGAGMLSGKGDFTFSDKQGKEMRTSMKAPRYDKDFDKWSDAVSTYFSDAMVSFKGHVAAEGLKETEESLSVIKSFLQRDIACILGHVDYMAQEALVPYLAGDHYYSAYPMYRKDLYEGKYKSFFTASQIDKEIRNMDSRDVIRSRPVSYRGKSYTRVNSLKASRKANILIEKRYRFDKDALIEKCKSKDARMTDFESEFLFWGIERRFNEDPESLGVPDYLMLVKMLQCTGFVAEYKNRYPSLFAGAPEMIRTLLEVEQDGDGPKGVKDVIAKAVEATALTQ